MKSYGEIDEHTPLTKTLPPDYVFMTNPNRLYRKQVHQFQCCICAIVLAILTTALAITILYSVDNDIIDVSPLPSDNASLQLLLSKSWPLPDDGVPSWQVDSPTPEELEAALKAGKDKLAEKDKLEAANPSLPVNSPSYRHQLSIKTSARATNLARSAYLMEVATKTFILNKSKPKNLTNTVGRGPVLSTDWLPSEECGVGPLPPCPPSAYRTIDGSCNNPYKPNKWGVAMRPYRRQLAQSYADGISKPRTATDGSPLPSARDVSVTVHRPAYRDDPKFTVMFAVWGQFMDHDVTATAISLGAGGKPLSCCQNTSASTHPECFPVMLSPEDSYYKQFGITCMEFIRSNPAPTCSLGPREQLNQVSSYLDASVVYGNTPELARALRSFQGGQLKMLQTPDGRSLLPISTNLDDGCNREAENAEGRYCFMSGDARANENTHITSLHTLMARQHNLVATQLADLNPEWNDEKVYQESRKVVAAQMQHITYNEFLPILLGPDMMEQLELNPEESGYYENYDPSVDATVSNNFASASFRFAHTLLPALMKTVAKDWGSEESVEMHKMLFDPFKLYQTGALDKVLQGAISTKLERADSYFNTQVTQHLFQATGEDDKPSAPKYGLDLVSLNVQRGRDHGLPAYPAWREYCGLRVPKTFADMEGMVDAGSLDKMKAIYKSVDDIDMYTGALSEFPIEGGLVGPTVTCLVSDQFKRLKQGDSFWYETNKQPQAFSLPQLNEIRKTTLAGIICDTSDEVTTVQPYVMRSVGADNARVPCSAIPRPELTKWMVDINEAKKSSGGSGVGLKTPKVAITVTVGSIKTNAGEILWDGTVPTSISLPLFNVKPILTAPPSGSFGNGVQWQGSTTVTADGIEISGLFSYPVYNHGPIPLGTNYSAKWVNGEFNLRAVFTLNDSDAGITLPPGPYESPIYFSQEKVDGTAGKKKVALGAVQDDAPVVVGVAKLPVILVGSYSPDKTSFDWAGKAVVTLPSAPAKPKLLSATGETPSTSGAFGVISGSVKLQSSDGTSTSLWSGVFPAAIPVPLPYKVLAPGGAWGPLPVFGNGLEWSTSISGSLLEGSFAFPQYNRTFGFPQVNWLSGQFSLEVTPLENVTLEELIAPGVKYTSRIILREEPAPLNVKLNSGFYDMDASNSVESLVVESQQVIDGVIPAPLILHGTFSPDKTVFFFNGKVILAVKPSKPKIDKQLKLLMDPEPSVSPWVTPKFGGTVNSGYVTAGLDGASPSTVWSGTVPVAIQMPTFISPMYDLFGFKSFMFGNGVIWSGTLSGTTIKGTYTLPQTTKSITGITTQNWSGEFAFEVSPLWNATLAAIFVPGAKYYSKIHFQGTKYEPGITTLKGVPGEDPTVGMAAPIILQGSYSLDKTTFYWSGNFIITFRNKPFLSFTIPPKLVKVDVTKPSITLDVTSGTIVAGLAATNPTKVWGGELPATITYSSLISKDSWNPIPSPDITWTGKVKDSIFEGTFAVPTYKQNGTEEIVDWYVGNFSFKYTPRYGQLLENFVVPGKKYNFKLAFIQTKSSSNNELQKGGNKLVQFTQEAQEVVDDVKPGKVILFGNYYSKSFYCYFLPICSDKQEYYWSGALTLNFPEAPTNNTIKNLKMNDVEAVGKPTSQFGGQVVSGSLEGGLSGESMNAWWSGSLPVEIPTTVFRTNKTKLMSGSFGGYKINWSGTLIGNTLKGSFSFPQIVEDYPLPTVRTWNGQFSFEIQPLWNATLDGLIKSEVQYSSGLYFQGVKVEDEGGNSLKLGDEVAGTQSAPIILQGSFTPDRTAFLWSGGFIISVKNYPVNPVYASLNLMKTKVTSDDDSVPSTKAPKPTKPPTTPKPLKPKTTVNFSVLTGQLTATNGSDPLTVWGGQMPIEINTNLLNPTTTPGAGVSINWTPTSVSPQVVGTFSVTIFTRNNSILLPVPYTGNFSFHYITMWGGSFDSIVKPGKQYTCSVVFKEMAKSSLSQIADELKEDVPKRFILGDGESSGTPCTLVLTGKSYVKSGNAFYCKVIPFMCSNKPDTTWFSFTGNALLVVKPPLDYPVEQLILMGAKPSVTYMQGFPRRVNTTVISGSIKAGLESDYPTPLWSGTLPVAIPLPVFWSDDVADKGVVPPEDVLHAHSVIWSGSQMGPRVEGYFSLPQYSKTGLKWWTGKFSFLFQTNWGSLGDLDEVISSGVNYKSRIIFRDIHSPTPLMSPSQIDIDTATNIPIILLGTYAPGRKTFYWSGNTIIAIRGSPWNSVDQVPNLQLTGPGKGTFPMKPKQRVGALVSSGSVTNITAGEETPLWSGSIPVTIPLSSFNISKGVSVIWSASTLYPKFSGRYSYPQYVPNGETFKIQWIDGKFSFDLATLWNTSLDVVEVEKEYATIISTNITKLTKAEQAELLSSFQNLIMESADLAGSPLGQINLKGLLTPDNLNFIWQGEAWFYPEKNKTVDPKPSLKLQKSEDPPLYLSQFGGSVYDGSVTSGTSSFFSLTHTVWSGNIPAVIPFSAFWSGSFFSAKFTRGITWTATSVSDSLISGSYAVPQFSWDGITTSVTWYKGDFQFYLRPLWNATITSLIQPGVQYYSKISFQGEKSVLSAENSVSVPLVPTKGVKAPIILQGTYSPDWTSFYWSGNFILNVKPVKDKTTL